MAKRSKRSSDDDAPVTRRRKSEASGSGGGTVKIDLREATPGGGGRAKRIPEGDYKVKIVKAERAKSQSGSTQIKITYELLEGPVTGKNHVDFMTLTAKAAFRVGMLLDAVGIKWKSTVMELPLKKLVGKTLGISVHDGDPYKGRIKSEIGEWYDEDTIDGILEGTDVEEEDDDEEFDEDEDEDEDEDDDEDDDEDLDELDDDDL